MLEFALFFLCHFFERVLRIPAKELKGKKNIMKAKVEIGLPIVKGSC